MKKYGDWEAAGISVWLEQNSGILGANGGGEIGRDLVHNTNIFYFILNTFKINFIGVYLKYNKQQFRCAVWWDFGSYIYLCNQHPN